ncbi:MAG: sterol desaturase family protein [bacterium]|nr:sterol desaturase family protein [bacterium]
MDYFKFILPFLLNYARYVLIAGIAFVIFYTLFRSTFRKSKIQKKEASRSEFRREMLFSLQTAFIMGGITLLIVYSPLKAYSQVYSNWDAYPTWWIPVSIIVALILHDSYFYWMHRLAHHPKLFRRIHLTHHKSTNPSPWTSYSFGLAEGVLESLIAPILLFTLPMHPMAIFVFTLLSLSINVYGHLGFEIAPKWFRSSFLFELLNTSVHHNLHHERFKGNYGLYFRFWDRLMGTENPMYVEKYDAIQQQRFPK